MSKSNGVRFQWVARINLAVIEKRMLWLLGTDRKRWIPVEDLKEGDKIRITVEKI